MTVAGLCYSRGAGSGLHGSGSHIYDGNLSTFHEWEFRTSMRLNLDADAIRAKTLRSTSAKKRDKSLDAKERTSRSETAPGR